MGVTTVAGLDEVGVGSIAGPLVAACLIVDQPWDGEAPKRVRGWRHWWPLRDVVDCKRLRSWQSAKRAPHICAWVLSVGGAVGAGRASVAERMALGERAATDLCRQRALLDAIRQQREGRADIRPELLFVDGDKGVPGYSGRQVLAVRADATLFVVAAASIVARALRDAELQELDVKYPGWSLTKNAGGPTPSHLEAIRRLGLCAAHHPDIARKALRRDDARQSLAKKAA